MDSKDLEAPRRRPNLVKVAPAESISSKICQFLAVILVFAVMVLAFFYVVFEAKDNESESESGGGHGTNATYKSSYSAILSQYARTGTCNYTNYPDASGSHAASHGGDGGSAPGLQTFWYQKNETSTLYFQPEPHYKAFVFVDHTYWTHEADNGTILSCVKDTSLGYDSFLYRLGLIGMIGRHEEMRRVSSGHTVYIYDGTPADKPLRNGTAIPLHVRAFVDTQTGVLRGYDAFYGRNPDSNVFQMQCWFSDMVALAPSETGIYNLPAECE